MTRRFQTIGVIFLTLVVGLGSGLAAESKPPNATLVIQGKVLDSVGNALGEAHIVPYLNGKPYLTNGHDAEADKLSTTGRNGLFATEIPASADSIKSGKWAMKITRPSFKPSQLIPLKVFDEGADDKGLTRFVASATVPMERFQGTAFWIALVIFIAVYVLIAFEILHRTLAAFLGAAVLLVITHTMGHFDEGFNILTYDQALHAVDWNVIFLLMGMMIIVGVLKVSGVFQWLAYKSFQMARGQIFVLSSALVRRDRGDKRISRQRDHHAPAHSCDHGDRGGAWCVAVRVSASPRYWHLISAALPP